MAPPALLLCLTSLPNREDAERIGKLAVEQGLAACAQLDGPIASIYKWDNKIQSDPEFRLVLKCLPANLDALEMLVLKNHPYDTPQWVCLASEKVSEKYLKWANEVSNFHGFH